MTCQLCRDCGPRRPVLDVRVGTATSAPWSVRDVFTSNA